VTRPKKATSGKGEKVERGRAHRRSIGGLSFSDRLPREEKFREKQVSTGLTTSDLYSRALGLLYGDGTEGEV